MRDAPGRTRIRTGLMTPQISHQRLSLDTLKMGGGGKGQNKVSRGGKMWPHQRADVFKKKYPRSRFNSSVTFAICKWVRDTGVTGVCCGIKTVCLCFHFFPPSPPYRETNAPFVGQTPPLQWQLIIKPNHTVSSGATLIHKSVAMSTLLPHWLRSKSHTSFTTLTVWCGAITFFAFAVLQ